MSTKEAVIAAAKANKERKEKAQHEYSLNPKRCIHCDNVIPFVKRTGKFCSRSCSTIYTNMNRVLKKKPKENIRVGAKCAVEFSFCNTSKMWYVSRRGTKKFVSPYRKMELEKYRLKCSFRFNVYNYPDKFDIELIEKLGWYTCPGKKRKNLQLNTEGVSRDHMFSVSEGYDLNVDPKIIAHPANCEIVIHKENVRKNSRSKITLPELLKRIDEWENMEQATRFELATS